MELHLEQIKLSMRQMISERRSTGKNILRAWERVETGSIAPGSRANIRLRPDTTVGK